jgi:hypothetical protein
MVKEVFVSNFQIPIGFPINTVAADNHSLLNLEIKPGDAVFFTGSWSVLPLVYADTLTYDVILRAPGVVGAFSAVWSTQYSDPTDPYYVRGHNMYGILPLISEDQMAGTAASTGMFSGIVRVIEQAGQPTLEDPRVLPIYRKSEVSELLISASPTDVRIPIMPTGLGFSYLIVPRQVEYDGADEGHEYTQTTPGWLPYREPLTGDGATTLVKWVIPERDHTLAFNAESKSEFHAYIGEDSVIIGAHAPTPTSTIPGSGVELTTTLGPKSLGVGANIPLGEVSEPFVMRYDLTALMGYYLVRSIADEIVTPIEYQLVNI